jgi:uncharacterized protein YbjT (DUF2867 family)
MSTTQKNALILGASGPIGHYCLLNLLENPAYRIVTALVRSPLDVSNAKLIQAVVNFDITAEMEEYYEGIDDVFCCLGTTIQNAGSQKAFRRVDFHIPTEASNLASAHGVKQFLAISCDRANNKSSDFYLRIKGEMEKGINQFAFDAIHIFRPPQLIINSESHPGNILDKILPWRTQKSNTDKFIAPLEIADAMVNAAQLDEHGSFYYSTSQIQKLAKKKSY